MTQPRYAGLRLADQVALLAALADGALDVVEPGGLPTLRARLSTWLDTHVPEVVADLQGSGALSEDARRVLVDAVAALVVDGGTP